jgi:hypothetical protein
MPELIEAYINDPVYPDPTYVTEWFNISSSQSLVFTAYCDQDFDMVIDWAVDSQYQIIDTDVKSQLGSDTGEFFIPVKTRFARFSVINIAASPSILRVQGFFFLNNLGLQNLINIGDFSEIFKPINEMRTIQSSDGSISVVENSDNIDLTGAGAGPTVTLTSAGGTESLINDGIGPTLANKGLTAGAGVSLVSSGTAVTISSTAGSGPYQQVVNNITPVSASVNAISSGTLNSIDALANNSVIAGSTSSNILGSRTDNSGIIASNNCEVVAGGGSGDGKHCFIVGSNACIHGGTAIGLGGNAGTGDVIAGCDTSYIDGRGSYSSLISSSISHTNAVKYSSIIASSDTIIDGINTENCAAIGCTGAFIRRSVSQGEGKHCVQMASNACVIGGATRTPTVANQYAGTGHSVISSIDCQHLLEGFYSSIFCSEQSTTSRTNQSALIATNNCALTGTGDGTGYRVLMAGGIGNSNSGNPNNSVIFGSNNILAGHDGSFLFSDDAGGTQNTTTANSQFNVRCVGGSTFYSNSTNTTGVSLAAGASSWAVVSDVNKKENLVELDDAMNMKSISSMPIYKYNYKGNPVEQICCGPVAQDWNAAFPCGLVQVIDQDTNLPAVEMDEVTGLPVLDEVTGLEIPIMKDAKDKTKIEMMDMVGILLSCVKDLNARIDVLEKFKSDLLALNIPELSTLS